MPLLSPAAALGLRASAVPPLPVGGGWTLPTVFAAAWLLFALAVVGSHLHAVLGVGEEEAERMDRLRRRRRREWVRLLETRLARRGEN